jgi:hypothetical protein
MFEMHDIVSNKRKIIYFENSIGEILTIPAGSSGTVLVIYSAAWGFQQRDPVDYFVEFLDEQDGHTLGLVVVSEADLEFVWRKETPSE